MERRNIFASLEFLRMVLGKLASDFQFEESLTNQDLMTRIDEAEAVILASLAKARIRLGFASEADLPSLMKRLETAQAMKELDEEFPGLRILED